MRRLPMFENATLASTSAAVEYNADGASTTVFKIGKLSWVTDLCLSRLQRLNGVCLGSGLGTLWSCAECRVLTMLWMSTV